LMIVSHRILRYLTPFLHVIAFLASLALLGQGWVYVLAVLVQALVLVAAAVAGVAPSRATLIARYYVLTTASLAAGLWDWLVHGTSAGWEPADGTR
jgi:hypothetical protein